MGFDHIAIVLMISLVTVRNTRMSVILWDKLQNTVMTSVVNNTMEEMHYEFVMELFHTDNRVLEDPAFTAIIVTYAIMVTLAVCGNSTVMLAVVRNKEMRTARNIFIFNLALSDFLMATSIPFTVLDGLTRAWPLPSSTMACR